MIRIIGADMDGTFFDENAKIPPESFDLIRELAKQDIRFCAVTGRRSAQLQKFFDPVLSDMDFVSSNGAEVIVAGTKMVQENFDHEEIAELGKLIENYDYLHLTVGDNSGSWVYDAPDKYEYFLERNGSWTTYRPGPVPENVDVFCGVVICTDPDFYLEGADILIREMGDKFCFGRTGSGVAIDFTRADVSKATGLQHVMDRFGVDASEVVMYGDALNDLSAMELAGHPVCVANALPEILEISERVVESNVEHGVQQDMARILEDVRSGGAGEISFSLR